MNDDRFGGASAVLADGDVVVIGGGMVATGERYDVKNDEWSSLAQMDEVRYGPGAAILPDGRVLVVGGDPAGNPDKIWKTTTIYDPDSDSWEPGEPMSIERFKPFAVALADGRVLVAGGMSKRAYLKSAEIYDPQTQSWSKAADMTMTREGASAALLPDGRVLLAGGQTSKSEKATLFYQPQLQIRLLFSEAARLQVDRQDVLQNLSYSIDGGSLPGFWRRGSCCSIGGAPRHYAGYCAERIEHPNQTHSRHFRR